MAKSWKSRRSMIWILGRPVWIFIHFLREMLESEFLKFLVLKIVILLKIDLKYDKD